MSLDDLDLNLEPPDMNRALTPEQLDRIWSKLQDVLDILAEKGAQERDELMEAQARLEGVGATLKRSGEERKAIYSLIRSTQAAIALLYQQAKIYDDVKDRWEGGK
jgi:hypothetical protein